MQPPSQSKEIYRIFEKGSIGAFVLVVILVLILNPTTGEIVKHE